jgi:hypothetical protein
MKTKIIVEYSSLFYAAVSIPDYTVSHGVTSHIWNEKALG